MIRRLLILLQSPRGLVRAGLCALAVLVLAGVFFETRISFSMPIRPDLLDRLEKEGKLKELVESQRLIEDDAAARGWNVPPSMPKRQESFQVNAAATRNLRAAVVLVDFSDNVADTVNFPPSYYERLLFSVGEYPTGSLRDYFRENSFGKLDVTGVVTHWLRMPQPYSYYVGVRRGLGYYPNNAQKLAEDAAQAADWEINFSNLDNDGPDGIPDSGDDDGFVDALFIVHAGPGYETTLDTMKIHSHQWVMFNEQILDGVLLWPYAMEAQDSKTGVFCHEFGHVLGLPDLYDRDYSSRGLGGWSLMAFGGWNGLGVYPGHLDAWSKIRAGFMNPVVPVQNAEGVSFSPIERDPLAYKLWYGGTGDREYFLVERREKQGFDAFLPGHGLLIYHVDEDVSNNDNAWHYKVALEQADGLSHLENNANLGDDADPYPGSLSKTVFGYETAPNSRAYTGADSRVRIFGMAQVDSVLTANIWVEQSPEIFVSGFVVKDSVGNNDGRLDAGETASLKLRVKNSGSEAIDVTGVLTPRSPAITMLNSSSAFGTLPPNSEGASVPSYVFAVSDTLSANPFGAWFGLDVSSGSGFFTQDSILVGIGNVMGFKDDMENPEGWEHYSVRAGWIDQWHLSSARAFSGSRSWSCTDPDSGTYFSRDDAGLTSPVILLGGEPTLSFYHWMEVVGDTTGAQAGGFVEISSNGSPWTKLFPVGGYPDSLKRQEDFPMADRRVFSDTKGQWEREEFNLVAYSNSAVRLRFRFVSSRDSILARGWYVDSLAVVTTYTPVWISSLNASEADGCVSLTWSAATELRSVPFSVWRSPGPDNGGDMYKVNTDPIFAGGNYRFKDCDVSPGAEYRYWVGVDGVPSLLYGPVALRVKEIGPGAARLELISPNPVTNYLSLKAWLPSGTARRRVSVRLFDISGRFVRSLYEELVARGSGDSEPIRLDWDTKDYSGNRVGSGVYFLRLEWPTGAVVRKVLVLRIPNGL